MVLALLFTGVLFFTMSSGCRSRKGAAKTAATDARVAEINALLDSLDMEFESEGVVADSRQSCFQGSYPRLFQLIHTRLELKPVWDSAQMEGKAYLTLRPWFYAQDSLVLDAKGFRIHGVRYAGANDTLSYRYSDDAHLVIHFGKQISSSDTIRIEVAYTARPNSIHAKGSAAIREAKGLYFINPSGKDPDRPRQLWTQGETEASSCWFPTLDAPNQKTSQEVFITVPDSFISLSNGKLIRSERNADGTRTDYWRQDLPHAPYLFMLASGRFDQVEEVWRGIPVTYYLEPEYIQYAKMIFGNTPEMLSFYSALFGYDYPWDKYAQIVVRDFVSGAMENTGAVIHYDGLQHDSISHNDATREDIIAHELAHHWFGDLVTAESWAQICMNESFATYSEYLWIAHKYGLSEADMHLERDLSVYIADSRGKKKPLVRQCYQSREEVFDAHSYQKGAVLLHYLRSVVGDAAFFAALKQYLHQYAFSTGEADQLRWILEEITGRDMKKWFDQFFFSSGHPVLEVGYKIDTVQSIAEIRVVQKQAPELHSVYELQFTAAAYYADGRQDTFVVHLNSMDTTIRMAFQEPPVCIVWDDRNVLPGELYEPREISEWLQILHMGSNDRLKIRAIEQLMAEVDDAQVFEALLRVAENREAWYGLRVRALDALQFYYGASGESLVQAGIELSKDAHIQVRIAAVQLLKTYLEGHLGDSISEELKQRYAGVFRHAIEDSSYYLKGYGLGGLYLLDSEMGLNAAMGLLQYTEEGIAGTVVRILRKEGSSALTDYLVRVIRASRSGYSQIVYMSLLYGNLRSETGDADLEKVFQLYCDHAIFGSNSNRRLQAINMLQGMSEEIPEYRDTVRSFFIELRASEKDEMIQSRIDQYLEE